jgi:molybdate transport system permease protein
MKGKGGRIFPCWVGLALGLSAFFLLMPIALLLARSIEGNVAQTIAQVRGPLVLSIWTALVSTGLCILLALPSAYGLVRFTFPGREILKGLLQMPMSLPHLVSGMALLLFFAQSQVGDLLEGMGIQVLFTPLGVVMAQFFVNLPYMLNTLLAGLSQIDWQEEFMARSLGASQFQSFCHIVLPNLRQHLYSAMLVCWSRAMGEFGAVIMLAGIVQGKTETLSVAVYMNMASGDLDGAILTASVLVLISFSTMLLFRLLEKRGKNGRNTDATMYTS